MADIEAWRRGSEQEHASGLQKPVMPLEAQQAQQPEGLARKIISSRKPLIHPQTSGGSGNAQASSSTPYLPLSSLPGDKGELVDTP